MSDNGKKRNIDLKILLIGDANVGKTTLLLKYLEGEFVVNLDITWRGVNLFRKMITKNKANEEAINYFINIWDIAGSENYIDFFSLITEPMNAIIIQTNADNVEYSLNRWINVVKKFVSIDFKIFLFVINKNEPPMDETNLQNLVNQFNLTKHFVIDSKNTQQVNNTFEFIFNSIITSLT